jgi:competence protein ComEC
LLTILKDFRVQQFWDNGAPLRSSWYRALREEAVQRGLYRDMVAEGFTTGMIDGVRVEMLHPTSAFQPPAARRPRDTEDRQENEHSLVLKLTYGTISYLFPGDLEHGGETFLLQTGRDVRATVLKVPHHGSLTSSGDAFLRAVSPEAVVFSVQRDNRFGHPAPAVLQRYEATGARIFRTDWDGAITFRSDGRSLWVETQRHDVIPPPDLPLAWRTPPSPAGAESNPSTGQEDRGVSALSSPPDRVGSTRRSPAKSR